MAQPTCPDCQRRMEGGFMLDRAHGTDTVGTWVEGPPVKTWWSSLKLKRRRQIPVYAWRCPGCTQVRLFAPED